MNAEFLVGSKNFWERLESDLLSSKKRVFIQTLSFEGDRTGKMLSDRLLSLNAIDVRIIVDSFTKWILNDKFLFSPKNLLDAGLRRETAETVKMIQGLQNSGVGVKFTNPVGFLPTRLAARNHKKLIVIDDAIAYIGGLNFSEHNFDWHDMMLRMEDVRLTTLLAADFISTWEGRRAASSIGLENMELHCLDGVSNRAVFGKILKLIDEAEEEIFVESPYLTFPVLDALKKAGKRGVAVAIVMPEKNNHRLIKEYALWESRRSHLDIRLYPGMTHLKALLIDGRRLVVGSSNFDYLSSKLHQEIVCLITDKQIISEFGRKVLTEDLKNSRSVRDRIPPWRGHMLNFGLRLLGRALVLANYRAQ